jgi:hypothetical protein
MPLKKVGRNSRHELKTFRSDDCFSDHLIPYDNTVQKFAEFIYISDEDNSSDDEDNYEQFNNYMPKCSASIASHSKDDIIEDFSGYQNSYYITELNCMSDYVLPPLIGILETIDEEDDEELINASSDTETDSTGNNNC